MSADAPAVNPYRQFACRLAARTPISPSFVRITLAGDELATVSDVLGDQRVKLVLGHDDALRELAASETWFEAWRTTDADRRPVIRTYTLSAVRADEVDIDVVLHAGSTGPGSAFAAEAEIGTSVGLLAADRTRAGHRESGVGWHPGDARQVMLIGDETAVPAIGNLLGQLRDHITGDALIEVPCAADVRDLTVPNGVRLRWFVRERGQSVIEAMPPLACPPVELADADPLWVEGVGGAWYLWAAGESGWVRRIRAITRASGRPSSHMSLMGYWKRGVALG